MSGPNVWWGLFLLLTKDSLSTNYVNIISSKWDFMLSLWFPLQWLQIERDGVSNHQPHDCLLNRLFKTQIKVTSKLHVTGRCEGNSPVTGEFTAQRVSNAYRMASYGTSVILTVSCVASDDNSVSMMTFPFQCIWNYIHTSQMIPNFIWRYGIKKKRSPIILWPHMCPVLLWIKFFAHSVRHYMPMTPHTTL